MNMPEDCNCYAKDGHCICVLGCDCPCHDYGDLVDGDKELYCGD